MACIDSRNHGRGPSGEPTAPPTIGAQIPGPCPHCGCAVLFTVTVPVSHPLVRGGRGLSTYVGCAACPWASPAVVVADPGENPEDQQERNDEQ